MREDTYQRRLSAIGLVYQKLTIIKYVKDKAGRPIYLCQCACGNTKECFFEDLKLGKKVTCGCEVKPQLVHLGKTLGDYKLIKRNKNNTYVGLCLIHNKETTIAYKRIVRGKELRCTCNEKNYYKIFPRELAALYSRYKYNARKRNYEFTIEKGLFYRLTQQNCFYCGIPPLQCLAVGTKDSFIYNGVDRKDNTIGYTEDNCVSCCGFCNKMKKNMDYNEFVAWIENLAKTYILKKAG